MDKAGSIDEPAPTSFRFGLAGRIALEPLKRWAHDWSPPYSAMSFAVTVRHEEIVLPTYHPRPPDRNPMFLESRVYQGSSGRVYPLPFCDRIAERAVPHAWRAIWIENEFLRVLILPEIGGRIHRLVDKTNGYDLIYHQPVIKPALVGLAGPWVSGGIEFNWPQHHRPATCQPVESAVEEMADGGITVWLGDHDPLSRMKGMHGVCLRPGRAVLELRVRAYNRTDDVQTFLWWANVATQVHEEYQSFFPPDATFVADHAKRAMSTFPRCRGHYYGVDYAARARKGVPGDEQPRQYRPPGRYAPDDLSWYANISVPTSYMCMGSRENFFGGYDHRAQAGLVHIASHHIAPGKKQWTWGNHEFGYAWDRNLTDARPDGEHPPYIELMAGVYTDNQPDFSFLLPGETKTWSQYWYPIQRIGPADHANLEAAVSLRVERTIARVAVAVVGTQAGAVVCLHRRGRKLAEFRRDLAPGAPLVEEVRLPRATRPEQLTVELRDAGGEELLTYSPRGARPPTAAALRAQAATEPPAPTAIDGNDELFITGLHLEQYRHATRSPEPYWQEALRRDPGDSRAHLALGRWHLRRGELAAAERHLRASIGRQTLRNPNPYDGEAHYQLGRCLRLRDQDAAAYEAFYKSTWNRPWAAAAYHALAEIDATRREWRTAQDHLRRSLRLDADNLRARNLLVVMLRRLGDDHAAGELLAETLALDPLDAWGCLLAGRIFPGDNQTRLDVAHDLARAGLLAEAIALLEPAPAEAFTGTAPLLAYTLAWLHERRGDRVAARRERRRARQAPLDYCYPARGEEIAVLTGALVADSNDARAHYLLGNLLYDRRRHREAVTHWRRSARIDPRFATVWRNLGIASFNLEGAPARARAAYDRALRCDPADARLLYERDQLGKRMGEDPTRRLRRLATRRDLVDARDDLTIEYCSLLNQAARPAEAAAILASRRFQPWEGGEGLALGQHVRTQLALGRQALRAGEAGRAAELFEAALAVPDNLGEARHLLANPADVYFWLGEAWAAAGKRQQARGHWSKAARFRGDFQAMKVQPYSEMTYYSALAWRHLGEPAKAAALLRGLLKHARALQRTKATIDYFATSLPALLLFADDLDRRQQTTGLFLEAQARAGLGQTAAARRLLLTVLRRDPAHPLAGDLRAELDAG